MTNNSKIKPKTAYMRIWRKKNWEGWQKYMIEWREKNKEKVIASRKRYYCINKEKENLLSTTWQQQNKERVKETRRVYGRNLRKNPSYRLGKAMSGAIHKMIGRKKGGKKWEKFVGYTPKELILHLEKQFDKNMTWENYGSYWEVDHIKPISLFNYTTPKDKEFKECWELKNLQPLEAIKNHRKGASYLPCG